MLGDQDITLKNNHEDQLALKAINKDFLFKFSVKADNLYISGLDQNIDYGWETPSDEVKSILAKPVTQVAFNADKTAHDITLNGFIYVNTELGIGIENFTKFKNICNSEVYWYLMAFRKNKAGNVETYQIKGGTKGKWYVKNIRQTASDFITGLNALKISFSITINKYS